MKFLTLIVSTVLMLCQSISAANLSGAFADRGVKIQSSPDEAPVEVSLRALFSLEFDPAKGVMLFADSSTLKVSQSDEQFEVKILDSEGQTRWTGRWPKGIEYTPEGSKSVVRLKGPQSEHAYALIFQTVGEKLLEVEVVKIASSPVGPITEQLGSYVFTRD